MVDILTKLEFGITESGDTIEALVPTWRDDVTGMPDIAEEVARIVSYDNIEPTIPVAVLSSGGMTPKKALTKEVTHYLAHAGLSQIITFSFMHKDGLTNMMLPEGDNRYTAIPILNPISEEFPYMRTTLVPAVIEAAKRNIAQQNKDLWLFETANVYEPKALPLTEVPHERPMACGIMMGKVTEAAWKLTQYDIQPSSESYYHPGVSAHYTVNGVTIANYGELHPQVVKNFDLSGKVYMFEIDLEAVLSITVPPFRYQSFSKFPGTSRDLAIVAPVSVTSGDIVALIKEHGGEYLESVSIFDVYEGEHIEAGYRSLAYNLQFRSMEGTLNDEDIDGAIQAIIDALATKNCKLR